MNRITMFVVGAIVFTASIALAQQRSMPGPATHNNSGQTITSGSGGSLCGVPKAKGNICMKGTPPAGSQASSAAARGASAIPQDNSALRRLLAPALGKTARHRGTPDFVNSQNVDTAKW